MVTPAHPDRPTRSEVARFLTRKLLLTVILLCIAGYLIYSHSADITSEINTYVPNLHLPNTPQQSNSDDAVLSDATPAGKPPSDFHPHSHDNFAYLDVAKTFWAPWAKAIVEAKPPVDQISPRRDANNIPVEDAATRRPRTPPVDLVDLSASDLDKMRKAHSQFREVLDAYSPQHDLDEMFHHRGVVTVGGGEYMGPAIVSIKMLRATGSKLPVEVFLANWDEYESDICETYLPALNARCLLISEFLVEAVSSDLRKSISHYQFKVFALLFSTFRNALLIDSDSIPLVDPAVLFDSKPFTATGFLSWPDFWAASESPKFYTIAGLPSFPTGLAPTCSEAGQIVIDKQRHLKTLLLAAYYNAWGPSHFYPLLSQGALGQGDKNTFESAAVVLNASYYRVPKPVKDVGRYTHSENVGFKGSGMVQYMPEADVDRADVNDVSVVPKSNTPAFVHANTPKMNAGHLVDEGDLQSKDGKRLRLWGDKEDQEKIFGRDVEKEVWKVVKETGCELASTLAEWKDRNDVCGRLKKHWDAVFA